MNYPWYYKHFTQIVSRVNYTHNPTDIKIDFNRVPHSDVRYTTHFGYKALENTNDILNMIRDAIDELYYSIVYLDEYYLPDKITYNTEHFTHQSLIYGYNDEEKFFLGITYKAELGLTTTSIPYSTFNTAFQSGKNYHMETGANMAKSLALRFIKLRESNNVEFTIKDMIINLEDYLNKAERFRENFPLTKAEIKTSKYGIEVYDAIIDSLNNKFENIGQIDVRTFHLLCEHKKALYNKFIYLVNKESGNDEIVKYVDDFKNLLKKFNHIRMNYLRCLFLETNNADNYRPIKRYDEIYKAIKNPQEIEKITKMIISAKKSEEQILNNILEILKKTEIYK